MLMATAKPIIVCFPFSGDVVGGSHMSALGLIRNLDPNAFQPLVVVQQPHRQVAEFFADNGVIADHLGWTNLSAGPSVKASALAGAVCDQPRLARYLRRREVDIVHTNDGRSHVGWAFATRLAGAKLVWHHRADPRALGVRLLAPLVANKVLSVSEFSSPRSNFVWRNLSPQVVYSPFDTDLNEDRNSARGSLIAELGFSDETLLVGYFGLFLERKRPFLFIDAVASMKRAEPGRPVAGLMFGRGCDGITEPALRAHAERSGVADCVEFMGFRTRATYWMAGCDVLMIPAVDEPFGRTLVEAMLVGTPIVATRSGGNPESLKDGLLGTLVPPEDALALAQACLAVGTNDVAVSHLADRARADAQQRFGIGRHVDQIEKIYRRLTTTKP